MKKLLLIMIPFLGITLNAQDDNTWRWGLQLGLHGNKSYFISGQGGAHARFHHNTHGSGAFDLIGRYDYNKHWMIQSGLGFNSIGFEHAIANFYSFNQASSRFTKVNSSFGTVEIPLMVSYKFNPNCKNWKWFISGGVTSVFVGAKTESSTIVNDTDGPTNQSTFTMDSKTKSGANLHLRFAVGREKLYKSGRILSFSAVWNVGLTQMATSTVNYTLDNQTYNHTFGNNGNFFGFRMAYFFKPFQTASSKTVSSIN
ncbi:MAG: PorT family protein [Bacteroidia bacterium]|nr:PorT family protein [Bacteroidia bacterium]